MLRLGERLSPLPKAILGRLSFLLCLLYSESAVSGGSTWLFLLLPKVFDNDVGMKENRLEVLLVPSESFVFFRPKENEVRLESVDRRGSWASTGMGCFMLTGGCERGVFSLLSESDLSLLPKMEPRLPNKSLRVVDLL